MTRVSRPSLDWSDRDAVSRWLAGLRLSFRDADAVTRDMLVSEHDDAHSPPVLIVDETFAKNFKLGLGSSVLGQRVNVGDLLTRSAARAPAHLAIVDGGRRWSYREFNDWVKKLAALTGSYLIPSNPDTPVPPEAPDLSKNKLIEYDFAKYGSSETRKRLLGKWTDEVKNAPK